MTIDYSRCARCGRRVIGVASPQLSATTVAGRCCDRCCRELKALSGIRAASNPATDGASPRPPSTMPPGGTPATPGR